MWGLWDKKNREFYRYYMVNHDVDEKEYPFGHLGAHLYMFETPIEAEEELKSLDVDYCEVMELFADEPEWVYY